jgi:hypothetical protein
MRAATSHNSRHYDARSLGNGRVDSLETKSVVLAPFVLPQSNWSYDGGKTNGVMPAHVLHKFADLN